MGGGGSVLDQVDQMMCDLFYRGASISELKAMGFKKMLFYHRYHAVYCKAEKGK